MDIDRISGGKDVNLGWLFYAYAEKEKLQVIIDPEGMNPDIQPPAVRRDDSIGSLSVRFPVNTGLYFQTLSLIGITVSALQTDPNIRSRKERAVLDAQFDWNILTAFCHDNRRTAFCSDTAVQIPGQQQTENRENQFTGQKRDAPRPPEHNLQIKSPRKQKQIDQDTHSDTSFLAVSLRPDFLGVGEGVFFKISRITSSVRVWPARALAFRWIR